MKGVIGYCGKMPTVYKSQRSDIIPTTIITFDCSLSQHMLGHFRTILTNCNTSTNIIDWLFVNMECIQNVSKCIKTYQNGSKMYKMDQNGSKMNQYKFRFVDFN